VALGLGAVGLSVVALLVVLPLVVQVVFATVIVLGAGLAGLLLALPVGSVAPGPDTSQARVDERETMFARARLQPGSPQYVAYYEAHHYWNVIGTDCGRCMSVCPYSHPDTLSHNLVRGAIRRSGFARRAALRLDNLFYGRSPEPRPGPRWMGMP
jgi:ferredoxin